MEELPPSLRDRLIWRGRPPQNRWHSFDRTPWKHPWLSGPNLRAMKAFSSDLLAKASSLRERFSQQELGANFAFVGNIANSMYMRAKALRRTGMGIDVIGAPGDNSIMSYPGWEEYDGELPNGDITIAEHGAMLPSLAGFFVCNPTSSWSTSRLRQYPEYVRFDDYLRWPQYFSHLPTLEKLQQYDALLAGQVPYLAYLSGRRYIATQMGGDIWYECSRDDALGRLQRLAFRRANAFIASNPWSFAHARRYGLRNVVYLPLILDELTYCPGEDRWREEWQARSGGSFFVLSTARVDQFYKASSVGLEGFAAFSRSHPDARLVQLGWGADLDSMKSKLSELEISDKTLILRIVGKQRLTQYLRTADCLLDQFKLGYFGATALEAMACGLPVIMRIEKEQYEALCETGAPPVLDAGKPEDVAAQLSRLYEHSEWRHSVGEQHRRWFLLNHSSEKWWSAYFSLLITTARNKTYDFSASPLCAPLCAEEIEYHAAELACAPVFPNYN
jgi:glycosyltransferase involved in cell wall biosynthesis